MTNKSKPGKITFSYENHIRISGKVVKKDVFVNYIPRPVFGFEIETLSENIKHYHRVIVFDRDNLFNDIQVGNQVLIEGEIQSRNYSNFFPVTETDVINAVELYQQLFDSTPTDKQPNQHKKQPISWKKLLEMNLIDIIPSDSAINELDELEITETNPYIYRVDWNGEVFKEIDETIYEVLAHSIKIFNNGGQPSEELKESSSIPHEQNESKEDINEVSFKGRISTNPFFDIEELIPTSKITVQAYLNYFENEKRFAFVPFEKNDITAEDILKYFNKNDFVTIKGKFFSTNEEKILRLRKVKPNGKTYRKKVIVEETKRFVEIKEIEKQTPIKIN